MRYIYNTINEIAKEGLDLFDVRYEQGQDQVDALLVRSTKLHEYAFNVELKAIARAGVGVNNIPLERCAESGIVVFNTPGANANAVKELVIASLVLSSRDVLQANVWINELDPSHEDIPACVEAQKSLFTGPEIMGKRLGVIGLGAIGVQIANAAQALGMDVYGYDPYISINSAWGLSRAIHRAKTYDEVFSKSDYITLHVPLNSDTQHLINTQSLKKMKTGVRILNFARGELVDDEAMMQALKRSKVLRYVTDFPNHMTKNMPNCIQIPHLGASTPESELNCAKMAVAQLKDFLEHGIIKNSVNYPDCDLGYLGGHTRLVILHRNIPNMVGQITGLLGSQSLNIAALQNASKKDWACTLIDLEGIISEADKQALLNIEGIVRVRSIQAESN